MKTEGFVLLEEGKNKHSCDHPGFTTVYREIEGGVQFSDDGSTYDPDLEMHIPISDEIEEDEIYTGVGVGSLACMDYYQYLLQQEKR